MGTRQADGESNKTGGGDSVAAVAAIATGGDVHTGEVLDDGVGPTENTGGGTEQGATEGFLENGMEKKIDDSTNTPAALPDPFAALSTMWSGWLSSGATTTGINSANGGASLKQGSNLAQNEAPTPAAAAAAAATDLLEGAGRMWNDVSTTLKGAAESVDASAIGSGVTVFRQTSGRLMEDMSRSVQSLNISLPSTDLGKSASAISSSTRTLLDKASASIEQSRREALEIFVDGDTTKETSSVPSGTNAPWDVASLPEGEKPYADALRQEMLKLVVDAIYSKKKRTSLFLSDVADKARFPFDFDSHAGAAMAALEADNNMRRLRAGLVPGKMKEQMFWKTYFYHVHRVRQTLVANGGVMPDTTEEEVDEAELLFGDDDGELEELGTFDKTTQASAPESFGSTKAPVTVEPNAPALTDGERNWLEDIEAAFKDDDA